MLFEAPAPSRRILLGVALVCFANLLLEVVLTRIFSAMMYYHFTFLAISVAVVTVFFLLNRKGSSRS